MKSIRSSYALKCMQIVRIRYVSYHVILNLSQGYVYLTHFIRNKILATFEEKRDCLEYYKPP